MKTSCLQFSLKQELILQPKWMIYKPNTQTVYVYFNALGNMHGY